MLVLFQSEWCPASHRVRQRLTELGVDYVNRQVPVEPPERKALLEATGSRTIPVLILENGAIITGEKDILVFLGEQFEEPADARAHRAKAANARRRYLEEECECSSAATH
jgi:glutathione S-transferase